MSAASSENSTNVRFDARLVGALAPRLLGDLLLRRFLATPRHPRPADERSLLRDADTWTIDAAGARVPVWSWGAGPTVLLVHGWGGRGSQLGAFVEPLVAAGRRVVAFDAPGHGDATGSPSSASPRRSARSRRTSPFRSRR